MFYGVVRKFVVFSKGHTRMQIAAQFPLIELVCNKDLTVIGCSVLILPLIYLRYLKTDA